MAIFYKSANNSVYAVVSEETKKEMDNLRDLIQKCRVKGLPEPQLPQVTPVFTFSRPDHHLFPYMTGTIECMNMLLSGHTVLQGSLWVPFSNGTSEYEMDFVTSLDEAIEAFGLVLSPSSHDRVTEALEFVR
ncbi:MAG TPA: hypothetical protein PLD54_04290 [Candidatus Levybacteria bacterium]|nr:hypothetical protein [Candidatus Levybacteria bacterium]